jgi:hypothetical protein
MSCRCSCSSGGRIKGRETMKGVGWHNLPASRIGGGRPGSFTPCSWYDAERNVVPTEVLAMLRRRKWRVSQYFCWVERRPVWHDHDDS